MSSLVGCVTFTDSSSFNFCLSILHSIYVVCWKSVVQSFIFSSFVKVECLYIRFVKFSSSYHWNTSEYLYFDGTSCVQCMTIIIICFILIL